MAHADLSPDTVVQRWINENGTSIVQKNLMFQWKTTPKYYEVFAAFETANGREPLTKPQFRTVMLHLSKTPDSTGVSHRMVGTAYQFMIKSRPLTATPVPTTLSASAAVPTATYQFTVPYRTTFTLVSSSAVVPPAETPASPVEEPAAVAKPAPAAEPIPEVPAEATHRNTLETIRALNSNRPRQIEPAERGLAVLTRFRGKYLKFSEQEFPNVVEFLDRFVVHLILTGNVAAVNFVRDLRMQAVHNGGLSAKQVTSLRNTHERNPIQGDPIDDLAQQYVRMDTTAA